jgi:hypothetical protein
MRGNDEVSQRLLRDQWHGIVLGTRHGTCFAGSQHRRTINTLDHQMVVLAVRVDGYKAERIGLIIFNIFIDVVDGVRNDFDLKHIPTMRRQMRLVYCQHFAQVIFGLSPRSAKSKDLTSVS